MPLYVFLLEKHVYMCHYLYLMCSQIPHEMASMLEKEDPAKYTFHSFRRTSATMAAEEGGSAMQLQDFFGWKSPNMTSEYISTSKAAITAMAEKLDFVTKEK